MLFGDIVYSLLTLVNITVPFETEYSVSIASEIQNFGYPVELHSVVTADNYRLQLHRIPYGRDRLRSVPFRNESVLLVHGLATSGGQWIGNLNKSTSYMLAEAGYDVWLFHARGTSPSFQHEILEENTKAYWNFSFHEVGEFDITASVDYILEQTGRKKLHLVGHSMGGTVLLVALSVKPEYNEKISSLTLLAPAVNLQYLDQTTSYLLDAILDVAKKNNVYKVQFRESVLLLFAGRLCGSESLSYLCDSIATIQMTSNSEKTGNMRLNAILKYAVDNVSIKQLKHFQQLRDHKQFRMFDYKNANNFMYNEDEPREYNLSLVQVPVMLMYGSKDVAVNKKGITILLSMLKSVKHKIELPYTHIDFVYGENIDTKVNSPLIKFMNENPID